MGEIGGLHISNGEIARIDAPLLEVADDAHAIAGGRLIGLNRGHLLERRFWQWLRQWLWCDLGNGLGGWLRRLLRCGLCDGLISQRRRWLYSRRF